MAAIMSRPQCVNLSDAGMIRKNDVKPLLLMTWFQDISNPVTDLVIRQYSYSDFNQHDKVWYVLTKYTVHSYYKVCDEIISPFPNFKGATVEVWDW